MTTKTTTILFQGDSITDAGRAREPDLPANTGLGAGYPGLVAAALLSREPARGYQILNRGISGNRVVDLYARWKVDALNLKPDLISILIGVNDTWHEFNNRNGVELDRYRQVAHMLLQWTHQVLPSTRIVLCEPFVLPVGAVTKEWLPEIRARQAVCAELSEEFGAPLVLFQAMFDEAVKEAPAEYWLRDGVHPSLAGHMRMADLWLRTVRDLI